MIKDLQPQYNRVLRRRELMTLVLAISTPDGYASVVLADGREADADPDSVQRLLAVYATKGAARRGLQAAVARYHLCPKLLGLERAAKACFLAQLGKCNRACEGVEPAGEYNARFAEAFERQKVVAWPYRGPVLIREHYAGLEGSVGFVVDGWCLMARLRELEDGTVEVEPETRRFDVDRYRIIRRFLENPRNRLSISSLSSAQLGQLVSI
jgi:hypothetical protein